MLQPVRSNAARTRRAFAAPHWLMLRQRENLLNLRRSLTLLDSLGQDS